MFKNIKKHMTGALMIGLVAGIFGMTAAKAAVPESKDPIKIVMIGYSGDNIIMYIYGELIKTLGYNVLYYR